MTRRELSPEEAAIIRRRTQAIARPVAEAETEAADLLILEILGERFALELDDVDEVMPLAHLARLPGLDPAIRGIVEYRGRLCAALDLKTLGDPRPAGASDHRHVVFVSRGKRRIGLLADSMSMSRCAVREFRKTTSAPPHVAGISADLIARLDLDALFAAPRLNPGAGAGAGGRDE